MTWYKILNELNLGRGLTEKGKRQEANQTGSPLSCSCHAVQSSSLLISQPTFTSKNFGEDVELFWLVRNRAVDY